MRPPCAISRQDSSIKRVDGRFSNYSRPVVPLFGLGFGNSYGTKAVSYIHSPKIRVRSSSQISQNFQELSIYKFISHPFSYLPARKFSRVPAHLGSTLTPSRVKIFSVEPPRPGSNKIAEMIIRGQTATTGHMLSICLRVESKPPKISSGVEIEYPNKGPPGMLIPNKSNSQS